MITKQFLNDGSFYHFDVLDKPGDLAGILTSGTILLEEQDAMSSGKASNEIVSFFKISIVFDMQR